MNLSGKNLSFRQHRRHSNPDRILVLIGMVIVSLFLLKAVETKEIISPFEPTPIPTRLAGSFVLEANTHFQTGSLDQSIQAYQQATLVDPTNAELFYEMARIQTYSSAVMTTDEQKRTRLQEALASIDRAVELAPDSSTAHAIRGFVLNWNSNPSISGDKSTAYLTEAEQEVIRALQLDNQNALGLVYYAELLLDQQKYLQAEQYIQQALERDPDSMDAHRVNGIVKETLGDYGGAIEEYKRAAEIAPNLTSLYILIGVNYRQLKQYDIALDYFAKAANINTQIGIADPLPYIAIGKTYAQMGEFFAASLNTRKALQINPSNQDTYGSLGVIYFKARNYESAIPALKCAVQGCSAAESCEVRRCDPTTDPELEIKGLPLTASTVVYYFTYGSVLAGMHRPNNNYCEEAMGILQQVRVGFSEDPTIISIIESSEQICASFGFARP